MQLGEPQTTPYDLRFSMLGFPVRVSAWFWLAIGILGIMSAVPAEHPEFLFIWIGACFVSILLHELGHCLAFRRYGIDSHMVLYHFGGLAIPNVYSNPWASPTASVTPHKQIAISAAGPGMQLLLAAAIAIVLSVGGYEVPGLPGIIQSRLPEAEKVISNLPLAYLVAYTMVVSIYWALLNLLPVYPLDGGQIARALFMINSRGDAIRQSLMLSTGVAAALALYGFATDDMFLGVMFAMLGFSSYQSMQMHGGFGRRQW